MRNCLSGQPWSGSSFLGHLSTVSRIIVMIRLAITITRIVFIAKDPFFIALSGKRIVKLSASTFLRPLTTSRTAAKGESRFVIGSDLFKFVVVAGVVADALSALDQEVNPQRGAEDDDQADGGVDPDLGGL